jgi:hypothetical protein
MLRVFIGYEPRQPLAYHVLSHSIISNASKPVSITPLILGQLPIRRRGLTEFTYSRYLPPYLCDFKGKSVFLDADIVCTGDINELADIAQPSEAAVYVMQDQARFEWPSVMVFNNGCCLKLTPEFIDDEANSPQDLKWAKSIGKLPKEWNHCVGYAPVEDGVDYKLLHYTQGVPVWPEVRGLPEDKIWLEAAKAMQHTVSWQELMGKSVHAQPVLTRHLKRSYGLEVNF